MYFDLFTFYRSKEWETLRSTIILERVNKLNIRGIL